MKVDTISNIYLILSVFVPGFIYSGILRQFVPLHQYKTKELIFLSLITATAFNYAICSPLIYLLYVGDFKDSPISTAILWFFVIFCVPIVLGVIRASIIQHDRFGRLFRLLKLRPISPIPTGWDWIFSRIDPCYVLITLNDGTEIAGFFGYQSMASSDPDRKDIYLEKTYTVPADNSPWKEVLGTLGIYVDGSQIAFIEFRK